MVSLLCRMVLLAVVALPLGVAQGGPGVEPSEHAALLPDDVDIYAQLNGVTRDEWRFLSSLAGSDVSLDASWRALAEAIGMGEDEAFERLLGQRASVALRGVWEGEADWAALLTTDAETAGLIRRKLKARPRTIVGGRAVLRLPGGRFQLTEFRGEEAVTVMMAPARENGGLFLEACAFRDVSLMESERVRAFGELAGEGSHYIAARMDSGKGWLSASARIGDQAARLRMVGALEGHERPRAVFDPAGWEELTSTALLAVVERGRGVFEKGLYEDVPALIPFAKAMGASAGEVIAVVVRGSEERGVEVCGAASLSGPVARAKKLDRGAARSLAALSAMVGGGAWEHDFGGLYPRAARTAQIREGLSVTWRYLGDDDEASWQPGWVVAGTSGEIVESVSATAQRETDRVRLRVTLDGEGGAVMPMSAWRSVGVVRPRALLGIVGEVNPTLVRLSSVERLRWAIRDLPGGRVEGEVELERAQ